MATDILEMCGFDMIQRLFNRKKLHKFVTATVLCSTFPLSPSNDLLTRVCVWVSDRKRWRERLSVMELHGFAAIFLFRLPNFEV